MSTQPSTMDYILEQTATAGTVTGRKMFGEYALFCDGKLVGLICDDELFIKPTQAGRAHVGAVVERPPYKGAKPCFWIAGDLWDASDWLGDLVRVTAAELPMPIKKPARRKKT